MPHGKRQFSNLEEKPGANAALHKSAHALMRNGLVSSQQFPNAKLVMMLQFPEKFTQQGEQLPVKYFFSNLETPENLGIFIQDFLLSNAVEAGVDFNIGHNIEREYRKEFSDAFNIARPYEKIRYESLRVALREKGVAGPSETLEMLLLSQPEDLGDDFLWSESTDENVMNPEEAGYIASLKQFHKNLQNYYKSWYRKYSTKVLKVKPVPLAVLKKKKKAMMTQSDAEMATPGPINLAETRVREVPEWPLLIHNGADKRMFAMQNFLQDLRSFTDWLRAENDVLIDVLSKTKGSKNADDYISVKGVTEERVPVVNNRPHASIDMVLGLQNVVGSLGRLNDRLSMRIDPMANSKKGKRKYNCVSMVCEGSKSHDTDTNSTTEPILQASNILANSSGSQTSATKKRKTTNTTVNEIVAKQIEAEKQRQEQLKYAQLIAEFPELAPVGYDASKLSQKPQSVSSSQSSSDIENAPVGDVELPPLPNDGKILPEKAILVKRTLKSLFEKVKNENVGAKQQFGTKTLGDFSRLNAINRGFSICQPLSYTDFALQPLPQLPQMPELNNTDFDLATLTEFRETPHAGVAVENFHKTMPKKRVQKQPRSSSLLQSKNLLTELTSNDSNSADFANYNQTEIDNRQFF